MARPLRIEYPGAVYHITGRGNAGQRIFRDDQDRQSFLTVLSSVVERYHWLCHAYCLIDNHYHLLLETPDANLSLGMRQLNGIYTQAYNRRHKTFGHVFQGRFKAILVDKDRYLLELCRYVVLNPVRAGVVRKIEQWDWSSYRSTAGMRNAPAWLTIDWILSLFGGSRAEAQKRYQLFVKDGLRRESPWKELKGQVLLGQEAFIERFKPHLLEKAKVKEIPRQQRYATRPGLEELFNQYSSKEERNKIICAAHIEHGYRLNEIAQYLRIHYSTVSKIVAKELGKKS